MSFRKSRNSSYLEKLADFSKSKPYVPPIDFTVTPASLIGLSAKEKVQLLTEKLEALNATQSKQQGSISSMSKMLAIYANDKEQRDVTQQEIDELQFKLENYSAQENKLKVQLATAKHALDESERENSTDDSDATSHQVNGPRVKVLYEFIAVDSSELCCKKGEELVLWIDWNSDDDWTYLVKGNYEVFGYVPTKYLTPI